MKVVNIVEFKRLDIVTAGSLSFSIMMLQVILKALYYTIQVSWMMRRLNYYFLIPHGSTANFQEVTYNTVNSPIDKWITAHSKHL